MRIQTKGITTLSKVQKLIKEIVNETLIKANIDPDIKFKIEDFSCDVVFIVDGKDQKITVNHDGLPEIFTMGIKLDSKGNVDMSTDNSKKSFIDDYVRQEMTGQVKEYQTIESMYSDTDLEELQTTQFGDVMETTYEIVGTDEHLVRYYKNDNLIGELVLNK